NIRLVQDTNFPEEEGTTLTTKTQAPVQLALHVRVPYWAAQGASVEVNGQPEKIGVTPSNYFTLERKWKDGDKIEVRLPMNLHIAPIPDDPTLQAIMYGPLVRSEEHTSELQSRVDLVCRLLLEKKKEEQKKESTHKHI